MLHAFFDQFTRRVETLPAQPGHGIAYIAAQTQFTVANTGGVPFTWTATANGQATASLPPAEQWMAGDNSWYK